MKKVLQISLTIFFLTTGSGYISADACKTACNKFKHCALLRFPKASEAQKKGFVAPCIKGCRKNTSAVVSCFKGISNRPNVNQCVSINQCLVNSYKKMQKK